MAYALLAELPAVHGLYVSFFPCLFYSILGTSKHLMIGAIAVVSLLVGTAIDKMATNYKETLNATDLASGAFQDDIVNYKIQVAASLTLLVGVIQVIVFYMNFSFLRFINSELF
jgi:MFS superfamily sulfate permease-like transporter